MSMVKKQGKLIHVSDYAVHDVFADKDVLDVVLEKDGQHISARLPVGITDWNGNIPYIGDTIEIGWDYERCTLNIRELGQMREPIPVVPIKGERAVHWGDVLDSYYPSDK